MADLPARFTDDSTVRSLIERLIESGEDLPESLREDILDADDEAASALIALLEDGELTMVDSPGGGWAGIHAVELLGQRGEAAAVDALIDVIVESDYDHIIYSRAVYALRDIGEPVVEPALETIEAGVDEDTRDGLAAVLSSAGVRDERIFDVLVEVLDDDPALGAWYLADYGDPRGVDAIRDVLSSREVDDFVVSDVPAEMVDAIRELGGEATDKELEKERWSNQLREERAEQWRAARDRDETYELADDDLEDASHKLAGQRRKLRGQPKRELKKAAKFARYRLERCVVNSNWREMRFATLFQLRERPEGNYVIAGLVVDLACVGPKDAVFRTDATLEDYRWILDGFVNYEPVDTDPYLAAKIVRSGALLAAHIGLSIPDHCFPAMAIFNRFDSEKSNEDVPLGIGGKPFYTADETDDVTGILEHLEDRLGPDGFDYRIPWE